MAPYVRVGRYLVKKKIGEGAFAEVRLAMHEETKEEYAVKVFNRSRLPTAQFQRDIKKEIRIMQHLRHPNIVSIHAVLVTASKMYLVMELVRGGELYDEIVANGRIEEHVARKYFQQLVDAMAYCHKRGVVHRDLKPENILLDGHGNVKITDFGMSWIKSAKTDPNNVLLSTQCGTPKYMPPELIMLPDAGYDGQKLDVWQCGMVAYALLAGYLPFAGDDDNAVFRSILNGRVKFPDFFSDGAKDLLRTILVKDPEKRATMEDIRQHPWFRIDYHGYENAETPFEISPLSPRKSIPPLSNIPSNVSTSENQHTSETLKIEQNLQPLRNVTNELHPEDITSDLYQQTSSANSDPSFGLSCSPDSLENSSVSKENNPSKPELCWLNEHTDEGETEYVAASTKSTLPKHSAWKPKKSFTFRSGTSRDTSSPAMFFGPPPKRRSTRKAIKLPHISPTQWRAAMDKKLVEIDEEPEDPELTETIIAGTPSPRPAKLHSSTEILPSSLAKPPSNMKIIRRLTTANLGNMDSTNTTRVRLPLGLKSLSPTGPVRNSTRADRTEDNDNIENETLVTSPTSSTESPMKVILRNIRSIGSSLKTEQDSPDLDPTTSWFDAVSSPINVKSTNQDNKQSGTSPEASKLQGIQASVTNSPPRTPEPSSSPWKYLYRNTYTRGK